MANELTTTGFEDEVAVVGIRIGGLPHSELMQGRRISGLYYVTEKWPGYNSPATPLLLGPPAQSEQQLYLCLFFFQKPLCASGRATALVCDRARPSPHGE
jgi:hypothetical protein